MPNPTKGPEPIDRPFKKRRHHPGRNAGQRLCSTRDGSFLVRRCTTVQEIGKVCLRYGVRPKDVSFWLNRPVRNNIKVMHLTRCLNVAIRRAQRAAAKKGDGLAHRTGGVTSALPVI